MGIRATQAELAKVGKALRGLQRTTFVLVLVSAIRFPGQPRLSLALAALWLPLLWRAGALANRIPSRRPRRFAAALAVALVLLAAATTVDGLRAQPEWPAAQWASVVAVVVTLPWLGLLRPSLPGAAPRI